MPTPNDTTKTPARTSPRGDADRASPPLAPVTTPGFPDPTIMQDPQHDPRDPSPNPMPRGAKPEDAMLPDAGGDRIGALERELRDMRRLFEERSGGQPAAPAARTVGAGQRKLLGQVPVYDTDSQEDFVARARELRAGRIAPDTAKRFRTAARITAVMQGEGAWKMAERLKKDGVPASLPIGFEFDRDEMPDAERARFIGQGAIEPIE